jgi:redox-sensitive bicupin YhaK (pirin superfamily)
MNRTRDVVNVVVGNEQKDGAGVRLVRVLGPGTVSAFDPFLLLDAFDSRNPEDYVRGFPWHPHRGIETVTYLIQGDIEHGDSLGNTGRIADGCCQWMTAGSGIIHQEMPQACPRMLGLQLWVNLSSKDKMTRPKYRDIKAASIPKIEEAAGTVAVIAGHYGNVAGATQGDYVKVTMLDVNLKPDAVWSVNLDADATVFAYTFSGDCVFGAAAQVGGRRGVLFGGGDAVAVKAGAEGVRFVLFAGRPLREPVAWGGPIVMNTQQELDQAFAEIESGTFIR